jgi:tRNA G18 (ribose-2'-O)-methylase SpoU
LAAELKLQGQIIIALEEHERSVPFVETSKLNSSSPAILVVGNEITGIDPQLLELCEEIYHIPMHGQKKSFNVAIAFGIAAYSFS